VIQNARNQTAYESLKIDRTLLKRTEIYMSLQYANFKPSQETVEWYNKLEDDEKNYIALYQNKIARFRLFNNSGH
jgi:hypothetical protein